MRRIFVLLSAGVIIGGLGIHLSRVQEPACIRLEAKLSLARDFCEGLAKRAATERCGALSDQPEVMGECMRVIVPAAASGCMDYLNLEHIKADLESACG